MGQALYRKYRSRSLKDVVGQEHITDTLQKAIDNDRISHAYLLTGPRGVGKTSVARIMAHQINGIPYEDDDSHIDIIEIDAASNRRIDEIRELREKVYVAPTSAKYKIYIIDEVHMLTREAFNALLKTLEEPPAHVIFILATTDAHKLPDTIISRTQRFSFKPAQAPSVVDLLGKIVKAEKFKVDDEALQLIAKHGNGSFRDSVSLLDQATSHGEHVDASSIEQLLGLPPASAIEQLINLTAGKSAADVMKALNVMYDQGFLAAAISQQIGQVLRAQIGSNSLIMDASNALSLLSSLIEVPASFDPERALEIALLGSNDLLFETTSIPIASKIKAEEEKEVIMEAKATVEIEPEIKQKSVEDEQVVAETKPQPEKTKSKVLESAKQPFNSDLWPEVLKSLKKQYNTLYGVVRMSQPEFDDNKLKLAFAFSFHQKRLSETANRQKMVDIIHDLTGQSIDIEFVVDKFAQPPKITVEVEKESAAEPAKDSINGELSTISNIFGNAELLES
jgi:DNA polymerase-3 subunit gamma/tau